MRVGEEGRRAEGGEESRKVLPVGKQEGGPLLLLPAATAACLPSRDNKQQAGSSGRRQ